MVEFKAERLVKSYTMTLGAPPVDVFPLLCPVREYEWIEPWSCDMVFSASGLAENNAVFRTNFPTQGGEEIWVVCRYDKDRANYRGYSDGDRKRLEQICRYRRTGMSLESIHAVLAAPRQQTVKAMERRLEALNWEIHENGRSMKTYVHGYSEKESCRLADQAGTLTELLHGDIAYPAGSRVLEAGCGVGAQTITLSRSSPDARFDCMDISETSLNAARRMAVNQQLSNVTFRQGDIYHLPYRPDSFDHVFVCFVLEHLSNPLRALTGLRRVVKPGGTITAIEGDHGSYYCHPKSRAADRAVQCLVKIQANAGGDALIGRRLYPLLTEAGYTGVAVSPRMVYVDASRPALVDGFTRKTFTAMVEGVRDQALDMGLIDRKTWNQGIADLYRTTQSDGTFCYTFFKGIGIRP